MADHGVWISSKIKALCYRGKRKDQKQFFGFAALVDDAGIALLNTALILIVAGIIGGAFAQYYGIMRKQETVKTLDNNMDIVRAALSDYVIDDPSDDTDPDLQRFPCPAPLAGVSGSVGYGSANAYDDVTSPSECDDTDILVLTGTDGSDVYMGRVPAQTLGLDVKFMIDAYGNHMTYAVSQNVIQPDAIDPAGAGIAQGSIEIIDHNDNIIFSSAEFALISHGPNGSGTTSISGTSLGCTAGTTGERQNCVSNLSDGDDAIIRYQSGRTDVFGANFYDDKVAYSFVDDGDDKWWETPNIERRDIVNFRSIGILGRSAAMFTGSLDARFMVADGNMSLRQGHMFVSRSDPNDVARGNIIIEDGMMFVSQSLQLGMNVGGRTCNLAMGAWPDNADEGTIRFRSETGFLEMCKELESSSSVCWKTPGVDVCDIGACRPSVEFINAACPAGESGAIIRRRETVCPAAIINETEEFRECCRQVTDTRSVQCPSTTDENLSIAQERTCMECQYVAGGTWHEGECGGWENLTDSCCEVETRDGRFDCPDEGIGYVSKQSTKICNADGTSTWTDYATIAGGYHCCLPRTEYIDEGCPSGEIGENIHLYEYGCNADGTEDPIPVTSPYSNNCCPANSEQRQGDCPDPRQIGFLSQERFFNCHTNQWSAWSTIDGGDNCVYDDCAPQSGLVWGPDPSCTGDITVTKAHEETVEISGTADPAEAIYRCNAGTWELSGSATCPSSCGVIPVVWGDGNSCSSSLPVTDHNTVMFVSDDNGNGQHKVSCNDGSWTLIFDAANECTLQNGECGPAVSSSGYTQAPPEGELCNSGTPDPLPVTETATTYEWTCLGVGTGSANSGLCTATRISGGACGSATATVYDSMPDPSTDDLCAAPSTYQAASLTENATNYTWFCDGANGGSAKQCTASKNVPGECSATTLANGPYSTQPPSGDRCTGGTPVNFVTTASTYEWDCAGSTTVNCSVPRNVDGACGVNGDGGDNFYNLTAGTAGNCANGTTVVSFTDNGTSWSWGCDGINAGSDTAANACSANRSVDGVCQTFGTPQASEPTGAAACSAGDYTDLSDIAGYFQWRCDGTDGGNNSATCSAEKACSSGAAVTWSDGAATPADCNDSIPAGTYGHLDTAGVSDSSPVGSATFECNDGSWQFDSGSCTLGPVGECDNSVKDGCTVGTANQTPHPDTETEFRWRCDDTGGNSGMCSHTKAFCASEGVNWTVIDTCLGITVGAYEGDPSQVVNDTNGWGSANYTCTELGWISSGETCNSGGGGGGCFVAGTSVTMADGSKKPIEDLEPGDQLLGQNGSVNTVQKLNIRPLLDYDLYAINGSNFYVTAEHPFMTPEGWKSIDPEKTLREAPDDFKEGEISKLETGDFLIHENGELVEVKTIEGRGRYPRNMPVYNPSVTGDNTYFADGLLVHNILKN